MSRAALSPFSSASAVRTLVVCLASLTLVASALGCSQRSEERSSEVASKASPASRSASGAAEPLGAAEAPPDVPLPRVHPDNGSLLFYFLDPRGSVRTTARIDEVPPEVRPRVLVVDVSMSAEERQAHRYNFFTDLREPQADGTYPVVAVSRYDAARGEGLASALPPVPEGSVIVYSAEWCGFCKQAKAWLARHDVPFVERDVEKQPGVADELEEKLRKANVRGGGVPVIDWAGTVVLGFDQKRLQALLDEQRAQAGP